MHFWGEKDDKCYPKEGANADVDKFCLITLHPNRRYERVSYRYLTLKGKVSFRYPQGLYSQLFVLGVSVFDDQQVFFSKM